MTCTCISTGSTGKIPIYYYFFLLAISIAIDIYTIKNITIYSQFQRLKKGAFLSLFSGILGKFLIKYNYAAVTVKEIDIARYRMGSLSKKTISHDIEWINCQKKRYRMIS